MNYIKYIAIGYLLISLCLLLTKNTKPNKSSYDSIIVLGNSPNSNNKPNPFLKLRLDSGIKLFQQGKSDIIILTGTTKESNLSEAEIMKMYCLKNGIPDERIIIETNAQSTKENLQNTEAIMKKSKLQSAIVVTSAHHKRRTEKYCTLLKLNKFEVVACQDNLWSFFAIIPLSLIEAIKNQKIASI